MPLRVLTALDHAKTQWFHFKAIVIAGMGTFTDAYDLFCITPVTKLIGRIYYEKDETYMPQAVVSTMTVIALVGMVIGQLTFGALGDRIGRRRVYGFALMFMVLSSLQSGFSICQTKKCVITSLCFFRFLLGIGIGGDYPLSATIMSEFANKSTRGAFIAAVFSMQGLGILAGAGVTMAVTSAFYQATKNSHSPNPNSIDLAWRLILMIGALPASLTFYWRMTMPETARYTALVEQNVPKATDDVRDLGNLDLPIIDENTELQDRKPLTLLAAQPPYGLFSNQFLRDHGRHLFACAAAWLIVDIPFYSSTLFQSHIYHAWEKPKVNAIPEEVNVFQEVYNVAKFQAIIAVCSTIPGYWAAVYSIDRIGRRKLQMLGFFFMAVFLFALAGPYDKYWHDHTNGWFMVLYGLTFFFSNFGPNTTTFIIPAELFPARLRSTCHGISGAAGKVGAIIGSFGFLWASQDKKKDKGGQKGWKPGIGMTNSLVILGSVCVLGLFLTYFLTPETKGRSLESNESEENQSNAIRTETVQINEQIIELEICTPSPIAEAPLWER
ncbi:putative sugar transporter, major facilitator superfamily, MFS transporter superfamily [Dioscorea sansibarensis]